jgi:glucokinase
MNSSYEVRPHASSTDQGGYTFYVLGVDIGGTHTNCGIAGIIQNKPQLLVSLHFKSHQLSSILSALKETLDYAKNTFSIDITTACFASAGVVSPDNMSAELTNVPWNIALDDLLRNTSLRTACIINDFQAIGYGINLLDPSKEDDLIQIKKGTTEAMKEGSYTKAIIGAGTGLGKSILIYDATLKSYLPLPSEGGHGNFPITSEDELQLTRYIQKKKNLRHPVSYEDILSGGGIEHVYAYLREQKHFANTRYSEEIERSPEKAPLISRYRHEDPTCRETFRLFALFYGRCAKNFVLDTLSEKGLYIAGGIAAKNRDIFFSEEFLSEFENAHTHADILRNTPIYVITNYDVSLYGSCLAAMQKQLSEQAIPSVNDS